MVKYVFSVWKKVVKPNERFIPPYETGASLYIRPLLIGTSAQVGVHPAEEYMFVVFVTPVGPYFKGGFSTNPYVIIREFDRAAPHGTGIYKVGGNYAASLRANKKAHDLGYSCEFYLDAKEKNILMNVVLPTSSVLRIILISLRNHLLSYLLLPIRA